ncbi:unnamed protein product [Larinioides sclopetarius]|uniref:Uncharacterized protein n=1 Tax=Larinioides sclopetarius TaxID=280406 RepID=A0AAV1ZJW8_9ARAC
MTWESAIIILFIAVSMLWIKLHAVFFPYVDIILDIWRTLYYYHLLVGFFMMAVSLFTQIMPRLY